MGGRSRSGSSGAESSASSMAAASVYTSHTGVSGYTTTSSYALSSSISLSGGPSMSLSEYDVPLLPCDEASESFRRTLDELQSTSSNHNLVRRAACCAALVETALESRRGNDNNNSSSSSSNNNANDKEVSPNEMFVSTLAALTSLQRTVESRLSEKSDDANDADAANSSTDAVSQIVESTALPLLEVMRRILPHVAHLRGNNGGALLRHQFGTLSRLVRAFVAIGHALPSGGGGQGGGPDASGGGKSGKGGRRKGAAGGKGKGEGGGAAGGNALLRQLLKLSTTMLLVHPPGVNERDLAKLLHATIIPMFHDPRPKVRKASWGAGTEIMIVSSQSDYGGGGGGGDGGMGEEDASLARSAKRRRKCVADFLWEYCHAVVTNYCTSDDDGGQPEASQSKLVHVLRFLTSTLGFADDGRIRTRFGEACLSLMKGGGGGGSANVGKRAGGRGGAAPSADVVRETLLTLLSCLERTEAEEEDGVGGAVAGKKGEREEVAKFASRSLAFLLQRRPSSGDDGPSGDVNVVYGRCLLACMERMLGGVHEADNADDDDVAPSELLALKLLPNVVTSMLHLCEGSTAVSNDGEGQENVGAGSEFNRLLSRAMPVIASHLAASSSNNASDAGKAKLRRIATETLPRVIAVLSRECVQIKYRSAWGSVLPGGYATAVATLATWLLESKRDPVRGGDGESELEDKVQSYIKTLVLALLRLHNDVKNDGTARTAVEYAVSTIVRGMGVELFLSVVEFVDDDDVDDDSRSTVGNEKKASTTTTGGGIRDDRAWLLPLLKQSAASTSAPIASSGVAVGVPIASRTNLSFFQGRVLSLARRCDAASADGHRTAAEVSIQKARVVELWSLFPAFCVCPLDMKENFGVVGKTVVKALGDHGRYPKLVPIICGGLKNLTVGIMERFEADSPIAKEDYEVLSSGSTKILPSLFKLVETLNQQSSLQKKDEDDKAMDVEESASMLSSKEAQAKSQQNTQLVEAVTDAIGRFAQICPRDFLQSLFKKVVQRLLQASTDISESGTNDKNATAMRMSSLLGLGQALVASGCLDDASLSLLYRAVRPLVQTDEHDPRVQKRAYKVLAEICNCHGEFITATPERLGEMTDLLVDSIVTCQVSARHMRLKCLTALVSGFDSSNQTHMEVIPKIMGEVLLCLKDSNAKTREASYQLLLGMATARDDMTEFFKIILAALGAQTTHMRSAAVMALSRLTFEYARDDREVQDLLPSLMQTVAVLFDDSSREVTKSVIGFVRVNVAAMTREQLEPLLPTVVGGIMKYNKGKDRFRAKIKIILKKLVRVYGYDAIAPLVPEKDARLLTHMRKLSERAARRKAAGVQDGNSVAQNGFEDMMESDEDDSDDGRTFMTGVTGFTRMTSMTGKASRRSVMDKSAKSRMSAVSGARSIMTGATSAKAPSGPRIKADLNGEILDMLDASKMARSVRFADVDMNDRDFSDDDDDGIDDMQFDNQGRMVISDGMPNLGGKKDSEQYDSDDAAENLELKTGSKRRRVSKFESVKLAKAEDAAAKQIKKQKAKKEAGASIGSAYKSKKSGGDVKKNGQQYEPYAYISLNAKDYTKKNRDKAVSKMGSVVRNNKRRRG